MQSGFGGGGGFFPFSLFEVMQCDAEFKFKDLLTMEVTAVIDAHTFELSVDSFNGVCGRQSPSDGRRVVYEVHVVFFSFLDMVNEVRGLCFEIIAEGLKLGTGLLGIKAGFQMPDAFYEMFTVLFSEVSLCVSL